MFIIAESTCFGHGSYYVKIIVLLIFRKTINAETVMFAVVQLIRGAIIAVIKQYSHFVYITMFRFRRAFSKITEKTRIEKWRRLV